MASDKYFTTIKDGQLAVATVAQSGSIIPEPGKDPSKYTTCLVQTDDGVQQCLKTIDLNGGGGGGYVLPKATAETLGGVKIGNGLSSDSEGTASVDYATDTTVGGVRLVFDPGQGVLNIITQD